MSDSTSRFIEGLRKEAAASASQFQNGYEAGLKAAREELIPQVEKLASDAVSRFRADEANLEVFRAQATVHAAAAYLHMAKESMKRGYCWDCGVTPYVKTSRDRRCAACDANDPSV